MGNKTTLTAALRTAIERSGLTYYRIGKGSGIDEVAVGRFARGEMTIRLDKADRLAAFLGLKLVADPEVAPPTPTPDNLARPMLARKSARQAKRKTATKTAKAKRKAN